MADDYENNSVHQVKIEPVETTPQHVVNGCVVHDNGDTGENERHSSCISEDDSKREEHDMIAVGEETIIGAPVFPVPVIVYYPSLAPDTQVEFLTDESDINSCGTTIREPKSKKSTRKPKTATGEKLANAKSRKASKKMASKQKSGTISVDKTVVKSHKTTLETGSSEVEETKAIGLCSICGKELSTKKALRLHMNRHLSQRPHECSVCNKRFVQKHELTVHHRIHTGETPFVCTQCNKGFSSMSKLQKHTWTHAEQKPYACPHCEKRFSDSSTLKKHIRVHTGEKPFECLDCKKCFSESSSLTRHRRVHTGETPYMCNKCGKCFYDSTRLAAHMTTHSLEKLHKCQLCGKCFAQKRYLFRHMNNIHAGLKLYNCTSTNLIQHMKVIHGEKSLHESIDQKQISESSSNKYSEEFGLSDKMVKDNVDNIVVDSAANVT